MSKIIKLTPEYIEECTSEFTQVLSSAKCADGKISYSKSFGSIDRKAKLYFTDLAWMKMQALIREFDKEVAWHGIAFRVSDESDEYCVTDIVVYPQEVSGTTVEMDTEKYAEWIEENIEDERFCNIRMQGHSHVYMTVSPSSVDLGHQEAILDQLTDDMFYIFVIWNKKGDSNIKIYDLKKNVLFENGDIDVSILADGYGIASFVSDAKVKVKEKYTYNNYSKNKTTTPSYTTPTSTTTPASKVVPIDKKDQATEPKGSSVDDDKSGKRKGKKNKSSYGGYNTGYDYGYEYDGDYEYPYVK